MIRRNKKSQVYGLNAFLFALAIGIILLVALLGTSREFENKSKAGLYRVSGLLAMRSAEQLKSIVDQERRYALDKSLFVTGAFGGYAVFKDMIGDYKCNQYGCQEICAGLGTNWKCSMTGTESTFACSPGLCYNKVDFNNAVDGCKVAPGLCYPGIKNPAGYICGIKKVGTGYQPDKLVAYWKANDPISSAGEPAPPADPTCIPVEDVVKNNVIEYAGGPYSMSHESITTSLEFVSNKPVALNYVLNVKQFTETGLETIWYPMGTTKFSLNSPPENPVVSYMFEPFTHTFPQTKFLSIYNEAKSFVTGNQLNTYFFDLTTGIIPRLLDEDHLVIKGNATGIYTPGTADIPPAPVDGSPAPFKALVRFYSSYPNHPNMNCNAILDASLVSATYPGKCSANMTRQSDGSISIPSFVGCTAGTVPDNDAIKCILWRTAEKINQDLNLRGADSNWKPTYNDLNSTLGWNFDMDWFMLTFNGDLGVSTDTFKYNKSLSGDLNCIGCNNSMIVNGKYFSKSDLTLGVSCVSCSQQSCLIGCRYWNTVQPTVKFTSTTLPANAQGFVNVTMFSQNNAGTYVNRGNASVFFNSTHTVASTGWMTAVMHEWKPGDSFKFCIADSYPGDAGSNCITFDTQTDCSKCSSDWINTSWPGIAQTNSTYEDPCGNGTCDSGEDNTNCIADCHCGTPPAGDLICNATHGEHFSNCTDCGTPPVLTQPQNLHLVSWDLANVAFTVAWNAVPYASGYNIYMASHLSPTIFTFVGSTTSPTTIFMDGYPGNPQGNYTYKVQAVNSTFNVYSANSTTITVNANCSIINSCASWGRICSSMQRCCRAQYLPIPPSCTSNADCCAGAPAYLGEIAGADYLNQHYCCTGGMSVGQCRFNPATSCGVGAYVP